MSASRTVQQILNAKGSTVWTVAPEESVFEALELMARHNVGALVVATGAEPLGVLSERDYARKIILVGKSSRETTVAEIMTSPVVTVEPKQSVTDCMRIMTERRVRHLPVLEGGQMIGIVSIGDVVKEIITEQEHMIEQLQGYISGTTY